MTNFDQRFLIYAFI